MYYLNQELPLDSFDEDQFSYQILPSRLQYKTHYIRQFNCWSFRCSWSIACRRYIYIYTGEMTLYWNGAKYTTGRPVKIESTTLHLSYKACL